MIKFELIENELILIYSSDYGVDWIDNRLREDGEVTIKRTFTVTTDKLRHFEGYDDDPYFFAIGKINEKSICIDKTVINTNYRFYFDKNIDLELRHFVAIKNISILKKIDAVITDDIYIGNCFDRKNSIPYEAYMELIEAFPNNYELVNYSSSRIAGIIKEFIPESDKYENIYNRYIEKKNNKISFIKDDEERFNVMIQIEQFSVALNELNVLLDSSEGIREAAWQQRICNILRLIYPQYILCAREISFVGIDGYDKRPDFLLVDSNGFIDVLEIKKPEARILTTQASYRNNYVPVKDFAGSIQQIEKYLFCLNSNQESKKKVYDQLTPLLHSKVELQVVNPRGMLLLGRSKDFNSQQIRDFELIKRQYKNIADIMTYDDLIFRLTNILNSLKSRV